MAFDIFFGKTRRSWSRSNELTSIPAMPAIAATPSKTTDALNLVLATDKRVTVRPRGKGAVISTKWKWG
jgi:hypothetical protein